MSDRKSTISITYRFKGDNSGLKDLVSNVERMQQAFRDGVQPAEQLKTSLINYNQLAESFQAIGASVAQLNGVVQDLASAYAVQEQAETRLMTVMQQRMGATAQDVQGIKDLCAAQQELGVIGDEVQIAGAQQLATFLNSSAALQTLIPAMNNLVAQQKGLGATQQDCVAIANLFGKAIQGQTSALRRVGITFTEAEEAAVKNGTEMERAAALARIITNNVGEMNAALAQTDSGKAQQLRNALGDVKEQIGGIVSSVAPYMSFVSAIVSTTANASRAVAAMKALMSATVGANGALRFISATSVASALGMNTAGTAARFLAAGLRMVLAVAGVGLVIQGLTMVVDAFTSSAREGADSAGDLADGIDEVNAAEKAATQTMRDVRSQLEADIAKTKEFTGTKTQEKKIVDELNLRYGETMGYFSSVSSWYKTLIANSEAYTQQMVYEARARMLANQIAQKQQENYEITHNPDGTTKFYDAKRTLSHLERRFDATTGKTTDVPVYYQDAEVDFKTAQYRQNDKEIKALQRRLDEVNRESVKIAMPVTGAPAASTKSETSKGKSTTGEVKAEKDELEKLEDQIRANQKAALTASAEELASLREQTLGLVEKRDRLREVQESLVSGAKTTYTPPQVEEIKTYDELGKALAHYQTALKKAQPEDRAEINTTITRLQALRKNWDEALNPTPKAASPLDERIKELSGAVKAEFASMDSPLKGLGLDELLTRYQEISRVLSGMDGDITAEQRESLKKAAAEYAAYARKASASLDTIKAGWGNIKGLANGINGIRDAVESSGSAWDKMSSIVDASFSIFEGIQKVIGLFKSLTSTTQMATVATEAQSAAATTGASAEVAAASAKVAAARSVATANTTEAASGFFKAHSGIPFVGIALAAAGVAAMIATMASLPKFAKGGIAYGPTLGLFGEYVGASRNPEVVAPLDRLRSLLGSSESGGGELTCKVKGSDLYFLYNRVARKQSRT